MSGPLVRDFVEIPLTTPGQVARVSPEDAERVRPFAWGLAVRGSQVYALGKVGKKQIEYMHRFIMSPPRGMEVDHINHDGLDNRRVNLRICTHSENGRNRAIARGVSGFIGVNHKRTAHGSRWYSLIRGKDGTRRHLGTYTSAEACAMARDLAVREEYGEFGVPNFPHLSIEQLRAFSEASRVGKHTWRGMTAMLAIALRDAITWYEDDERTAISTGCWGCTDGNVPDRYNAGKCWLHRGKDLLKKL